MKKMWGLSSHCCECVGVINLSQTIPHTLTEWRSALSGDPFSVRPSAPLSEHDPCKDLCRFSDTQTDTWCQPPIPVRWASNTCPLSVPNTHTHTDRETHHHIFKQQSHWVCVNMCVLYSQSQLWGILESEFMMYQLLLTKTQSVSQQFKAKATMCVCVCVFATWERADPRMPLPSFLSHSKALTLRLSYSGLWTPEHYRMHWSENRTQSVSR